MNQFLLPENYQFRPARMEDLEATVQMLNACALDLIGTKKFQVSETSREWRTPGFKLETDTRLVIAPDGQVAGYYEVWDLDDPHVLVNIWGRVHPEHTGRGIGSYLLAWAEQRACQAIPKAPPQARVAVRAFVSSLDSATQDLFLRNGYSLIRKNLRMIIDLNSPPPAPELADGIIIRPMKVGQEEREVVTTVRESFRDHWGYVEHPIEEEFERWKNFMKNSQYFDPSLWFVAVDGDQIVGTSLCDAFVSDDHDMGWVGSLGVLRSYRKQGLGLALLLHSFGEFYRRGKRKVGLGVDADSLTGATRLYLKAGMRSDPQREYNIYEKELRPGEDLSTQTVET